MELLRHIDKFGVEAIMGKRVLGAKEARWMVYAENIINAYHSRSRYRDKDGSENWAEWAAHFPYLSRVLIAAEKAVEELDNGGK